MKQKGYVLTVSYTDYTKSLGGTDKTILAQQILFNKEGIDDIHIFPINTICRIKVQGIPIWGVCFNGKFVSVKTTSMIVKYLHDIQKNDYLCHGIIIHHLMGINLSELKLILECINGKKYMYIHDYMTICDKGGLVENSIKFCGASIPNREKCKGCKHYSLEVELRQKEIAEFFENFRDSICFLFPSESAYTVWEKVYPSYKDQSKVVYHQKLINYYRENHQIIKDSDPLKIAFVGYQSPVKGWEIWFDAVKKIHVENHNYELYQFGKCSDKLSYVKEVEVDFRESMSAMVKALRKYNIDIAVLWSVWPETYSFTYYESFAANCFILTCEESGNIAKQVKERKNGIVFKDIFDLEKILSDEELLRKYLNDYIISDVYGPDKLIDNDYIVQLIVDEKNMISNILKIKRTEYLKSFIYKIIFMIRNSMKR